MAITTVSTMVTVSTVVVATVMMVLWPVVVPRRRVVMVMVPAAPVARACYVRRGAIGLVGGRPTVIGLGASGNCGQQSERGDDVDPAHAGILPF
ncbi:hypothetical protein [Belnapia rosea]|uniref:hypothetical protein n=1 Tax=Belnapia rosea TaxID=938405 RepID=UPI000884CB8D|nr:hypothetical protein [Belnapia rosea]SDB71609.1 hypothetical protein SAMN02927895_04148 [Belnapia rosea]